MTDFIWNTFPSIIIRTSLIPNVFFMKFRSKKQIQNSKSKVSMISFYRNDLSKAKKNI